jgi:hypothetical protein
VPFEELVSKRFECGAAIIFCVMPTATVIPVHSGETIGPGLLSKILRDCEMSADELDSLL